MDETPLQLLGINGGVDKHGIVSVTVPFYVATLSEAISYTPELDIDLPIVSRTFRQSEDGGYEVVLTCEGADDDPKDDQKSFELEASMSEEPIKTHPKFEDLKKQFGWDESLSTFSEYLPGNTSSGGLASGSQNGSARKRSKMYGVESWLVAGAIYRVTYASKTVPQAIFLGIGTVQTPPSIGKFNLPNLGKRNWLKLAPKVRMRGNISFNVGAALTKPGETSETFGHVSRPKGRKQAKKSRLNVSRRDIAGLWQISAVRLITRECSHLRIGKRTGI